MHQWRCSACGEWFGADGFYADKRRTGGLKSECKKCHCLTTIASRNLDNHRDNNKRWMRESGYQQRPEVRERQMWRSRVRGKTIEVKARALANRAVDLGFLVRPAACPKCGRSDLTVHAHHADYSRPLDVTWMCSDCHGLEHREALDEMHARRSTPSVEGGGA